MPAFSTNVTGPSIPATPCFAWEGRSTFLVSGRGSSRSPAWPRGTSHWPCTAHTSCSSFSARTFAGTQAATDVLSREAPRYCGRRSNTHRTGARRRALARGVLTAMSCSRVGNAAGRKLCQLSCANADRSDRQPVDARPCLSAGAVSGRSTIWRVCLRRRSASGPG